MGRPFRISLALAATALGLPVPAVAQEAFAFQNVRVFDGERVIDQATVVVENGTIVDVGPDAGIPEGAEVIDGAGRMLLPGLIDAHTHTFDAAQLRQALAFGVTTQLDQVTDAGFARQMRSEQKAGGGAGRADLFSAGFPVTAPGGHGTQFFPDAPTISGPEGAQAFVDERLAEGSDWIKIIIDDGRAYGISFPTISEETLGAAILAAHARDEIAVVHIGTRADARTAIRLGADGLVHLFTDSVPESGFGEFVAGEGAFVIPTLTVLEGVSGKPSGAGLVDDPRLGPFLEPAVAANLGRAFPVRPDRQPDYQAGVEAARQLDQAGVPILAGSDAPNPGTTHGASLHREMELLVEAGLEPVEALVAATSAPAEGFGLDDRGRIAPGLRADLVLVEGDPTQDIRATRAIEGVWKAGVRFDRDAYREKVATQLVEAATQKAAPPPPGSESGLVSDFDGAVDSGEPEAEFGSGWAVSTDAMMQGKSTAEMKMVEGGAEGSAGALEVTGEIRPGFAFPWAGPMFFPGATPFGPANLSSKKELSFRAKGDGNTYRVLLFSAGRGPIPIQQSFVAGAEWERHALPLAAFDGIDGRDLQGILFTGGPEPGPVSFRIDEVRLD
ncbi:MAG: CIA30 family protein [Gemmatimonadota bacterium]